MIGRLTGDIQITCDDCAAVLMIRNEYVANMLPVRFCPYCGTDNLHMHKAPLAEMLKAKCFDKLDPQLVQLLYSVWATEPDTKKEYPRFVDYVTAQVNAAIKGE